MNLNPGIEAVHKLVLLGYRFTVNGETVKAKYEGEGEPDPAQVGPLWMLVKEHKPQVISYLAQRHGVLTCVGCPWCSPNPWTHYPEWPLWCSWHFNYLSANSEQCQGWLNGEIPPSDPMRSHRRSDLADSENMTREAAATCYSCRFFTAGQGPNPQHAFGHWENVARGGLARRRCATCFRNCHDLATRYATTTLD